MLRPGCGLVLGHGHQCRDIVTPLPHRVPQVVFLSPSQGGSWLQAPGHSRLGEGRGLPWAGHRAAWGRQQGTSVGGMETRARGLARMRCPCTWLARLERPTALPQLPRGLCDALGKCQGSRVHAVSPAPAPAHHTSICPFSAASCRGVPPQASLVTGAPISRSRSRMGVWPPRAAKCRAVAPSLSRAVRPMSVNVTWRGGARRGRAGRQGPPGAATSREEGHGGAQSYSGADLQQAWGQYFPGSPGQAGSPHMPPPQEA